MGNVPKYQGLSYIRIKKGKEKCGLTQLFIFCLWLDLWLYFLFPLQVHKNRFSLHVSTPSTELSKRVLKLHDEYNLKVIQDSQTIRATIMEQGFDRAD